MAIAILNELQQRLHTSAIAGVNLLEEDFRLKKTISQFSEVAKASPVLDKIAKMAAKLCESGCENRSGLLLDTITLVDAVICTQAAYQTETEALPISLHGGGSSSGKCSELAPVIEALTSKGSGRYEIIKHAYEENFSLLQDFRLKPILVNALNDSYSELADLIILVLQQQGAEVIPLLKDGFDPKGKKDMVRRLKVMKRVAGAAEMEFYQYLLQEGSAAIREEAISALALCPENLPQLVQIAETSKGGQKKAAEQVLSHFDTPETEAYWKSLNQKSLLTTLPNTWCSISITLSDQIAEMMEHLLEAAKVNQKDSTETFEQISVVNYLTNKYSPRLFEVLNHWGEQEKLLTKITSTTKQPQNYYRRSEWSPVSYIDAQLVSSLIMRPDKTILNAVSQLHPDAYCGAVLAAKLIKQDDDAFDFAEPYLRQKDAAEKIAHTLNRLHYDTQINQYFLSHSIENSLYQEIADGYPEFLRPAKPIKRIAYQNAWYSHDVHYPIGERLDPRWISQLNSRNYHLKGLERYEDVSFADGTSQNVAMPPLYQFYNPNDPEGIALLIKQFKQQIMQGGEIGNIFALVNLGEVDLHPLVIAYLKRHPIKQSMIPMLHYLPLDNTQMTNLVQEIIDLLKKDEIKLYRYMRLEPVLNQLNKILAQLAQGISVREQSLW